MAIEDKPDIDSGPLSQENKDALLAELGAMGKPNRADDMPEEDDDPLSAMKQDGAEHTSAKPKPKAPPKPAAEEKTELNKDQQIKLRVKQEAQRYRAQAQKEAADAMKLRQEVEAEKVRQATQQAQFEQKMQELEALKRKAREAPKEFLSEVGTSLDDVVRGELENGKPDARVTQAERELMQMRKEFKEFQQTLADEKKRIADEAEAARAAAAHQKLLDDQRNAEETFLKTIQDGEYPELENLLDEPGYIYSMGYAAHSKFKTEHGREPSFEELAATVEKALAKRREKKEDADDDRPKAKRKGSVSAGGNAPTTSPDTDEMDDDAKVRYATKELRRMQNEQKKLEKGN